MKSTYSLLIVIALLTTSFVDAQQSIIFSSPLSGNKNQTLFFLNENDGGISGINSVPVFQCSTTITPMVLIENYGNNTLTSATIQYFLDGGLPQLQYWNGTLEPFFTDTVFLPPMQVTEGNHLLTVQVTQANGESDFNNSNNESIEFNIVGNGLSVPYQETFSSPQLPAGYFIDNSNDGPTWEIFDNPFVYGSYNLSLRMPFYTNDVDADIDELYTTNFDLSASEAPQLSFSIAYAYYSEDYWDELQIQASIDCGNNWQILYDKAKDELATVEATDLPFIPLQLQWRKELINLSQFVGEEELMIRFKAISGHGNNLYIDNIAIDENTGIENLSSVSFNCFPNPANEYLHVSLKKSFSGKISLANMFGQILFEETFNASSQIVIPTHELGTGNYLLSVVDENKIASFQKIVISH